MPRTVTVLFRVPDHVSDGEFTIALFDINKRFEGADFRIYMSEPEHILMKARMLSRDGKLRFIDEIKLGFMLRVWRWAQSVLGRV